MANSFLKIKCPNCGRRLKIEERSVGKAIVCPRCNATFRVEGNSSTVVIEGRNDLFGPPVGNKYSDDPEDSGAFGDIDRIIESHDQKSSDTSSRKLKPADSPRRPNSKYQRSEKPNRRDSGSESSRQERSLSNGGIGLLILSAGICLLPFAAGGVDGLRDLLPMLPVFAVALAFLGCFMLAYSRRRESMGSLILAGLPLLFIALMGFGSFYYAKNFLPDIRQAAIDSPEDDLRDFVDDEDDPMVAAKEEPDVSDRFTIDRESINNNPASHFVPKPAAKPVAPDASSLASSTGQPQRSGLGFAKPDRLIDLNPNINDSVIDRELKSQLRATRNDAKLERLKQRIKKELYKGLCRSGQPVKPVELKTQYQLTEVVGKPTVYGTAYFSRLPITGFDFSCRKNDVDELIDMIVPIDGLAEFNDSIVAGDGLRLVGIKVFFKAEGIVGLQGMYSDGNVQHASDWAGQTPADNTKSDQVVSLFATEQLHGVVLYRQKLAVVGIQLVEKRTKQPNTE